MKAATSLPSTARSEEQQVAVGVRRVREETDVAEHPAEINEAQDRERRVLELTLGPIPRDRNDEDEAHDEHRQGHEEPVPARNVEPGIANQRRDADRDDAQVDGTGHPPVSMETRRAGEFPEADQSPAPPRRRSWPRGRRSMTASMRGTITSQPWYLRQHTSNLSLERRRSETAARQPLRRRAARPRGRCRSEPCRWRSAAAGDDHGLTLSCAAMRCRRRMAVSPPAGNDDRERDVDGRQRAAARARRTRRPARRRSRGTPP